MILTKIRNDSHYFCFQECVKIQKNETQSRKAAEDIY